MKDLSKRKNHTDIAGEEIEPALLRGLTESRLSRRALLRAGTVALGTIGFPSLASASGATDAGEGKDVDWSAWWAQQKPTDDLVFANWPYYIDVTDQGKTHPSLDAFTKATGIKVKYLEVIQNNQPFYAKIAPVLKAGQSTGYDIIVMTNGWQLTELMMSGWLTPLWHEKIPNFYKYASPSVIGPDYDKSNKYTVTWQSGFTGIGYNPKLTKREITSVDDLWDPAFAGHVGMMSDNTELGALGLLKLGINPATSTPSDWDKAANVLRQQKDAGIVRQYYDQSYIDALQNGDIWISQAWSGDIFQANGKGYKDLQFVVPKEGVMLWHDNMMIPLRAKNPLSALAWMNFYYTPDIAGMVADWVNYVTPVPAAQEYVRKELDDPDVADSPLVFPTNTMYAKTRDYYTFKSYDEYQRWNNVFNPIIQA
jgi:spermidine/putrescine transport system substrate-binding protein